MYTRYGRNSSWVDNIYVWASILRFFKVRETTCDLEGSVWRYKRIGLAAAALCCVVAAIIIEEGWTYHHTLGGYASNAKDAIAVSARMDAIGSLRVDIADIELSWRDYLISGDAALLASFGKRLETLNAGIADLKRTQPPERTVLVTDIERFMAVRMEQLRAAAATGGKGVEFPFRVAPPMAPESQAAMMMLDNLFAEDQFLRKDVRGRLEGLELPALTNRMILAAMAVLALLVAGVTILVTVLGRNEELTLKILHESRHDGLTGLPNRSFFMETLNYMLAVAERGDLQLAVLFMDLDGFKSINDEMGHEKGDAVLVDIARVLRGNLRGADFLARFGGDEFVILMPTVQKVCDACTRIVSFIDGLPIAGLEPGRLGISVGIAVFPNDGREADRLMMIADERMYARKRARKNGPEQDAFCTGGECGECSRGMELQDLTPILLQQRSSRLGALL